MMNRTKAALVVVCASLPVCVVLIARAMEPTEPPETPAVAAFRAAESGHDRKAAGFSLMQAGELEAARAEFQWMIDSPVRPIDRVEGYRLLAMVQRRAGDVELAEATLTSAATAYDADASLGAAYPLLAGTIRMDRADHAAFSARQPALAIQLYDEVRAMPDRATPRDLRIAAQNAAVLCAEIGRRAEAVARVDDLLASKAGHTMPGDERLALRLSQVDWLSRDDNLGEAFARGKALWEAHKDDGDLDVLRLGPWLAHRYAVTTHCEERLNLLRAVMARVEASRAVVASEPASLAAWREIRRDALVAIVDSSPCGDDALVNWAAQQLESPAP